MADSHRDPGSLEIVCESGDSLYFDETRGLLSVFDVDDTKPLPAITLDPKAALELWTALTRYLYA